MIKMKYSLSQIYQIVASVLFLIGAVFMLVNTFADQQWAFWTGLAFALVALGLYVALIFENRRVITKKLTDSSYSDTGDNKIGNEKIETENAKNQDAQVQVAETKTSPKKTKTQK